MFIAAMPSLCDSTDFGLTSEEKNKEFLQKLMKRKVEILESDDKSVLYYTGSEDGGYYFLVSTKEQLLVYVSQYKKKRVIIDDIHTITQVCVWRAIGFDLPMLTGIVRRVIFQYYIPRMHRLMSDRIQTERGRDLWLDLLGIALSRGLHVAIIDFNAKKMLEIDSKAELRLYDSYINKLWKWNSMKHQALRLMLSDTKFRSAQSLSNYLNSLEK